MANKKIIFLIPTLAQGGGERVVSQLSLGLDKNIDKVIVLFKEQVSYPYSGKLVSLNIRFTGGCFSKVYNLAAGLFKFRSIVRKENPDYVISLGNSANIINSMSGSRAIIRVDNSLSHSNQKFWEKIYKVLVKIMFKKAYKVVAVSKGLADDLVRNFKVPKEKILVIYNPINIQEIKKLSQEPLGKHDAIFRDPVIINVGRLTQQKGQWHLIKSFKLIKEKIGEVKLVILGEGELGPDLKNLAKELGLEKDILFLGWQKNPFKYLSRSGAFVLSSLWEGLGCVILEAMACGLPVVSVDCKSGPREILAPRTDTNQEAKDIEYEDFGILTPIFDEKNSTAEKPLTKSEELLGKALIRVLTDKNLSDRLSQKSKQRADDFDIENIIKDWDFLKD